MGTLVTKPDNDAGGYEPTPVMVAPGTPGSLNAVLTRTCLPSLGKVQPTVGPNPTRERHVRVVRVVPRNRLEA